MPAPGEIGDVDPVRRFTLTTTGVAVVAFGHALVTWPLPDVLALFVGGAVLALLAEASVIRLGLLQHAMTPRLAGVPLVVLAAWPATTYVFYRIALLALPAGVEAAAVAAVLGTAYDVVADPQGVREGVWSYPEHRFSSPRLRGVPWWNFAGWLVLVFATAMLPTWVG